MVALFSSAGWAQKVAMSVEQAQAFALENNKLSKNALLSIDEAQAKYWEAVAAGLPQVDISADYNNFLGASASFFGQKISFNPTSNAQITVSQLLFNGQYLMGVQLSKVAQSISKMQKHKTDHELKIDVANAYYLALVAQKSKELISDNLKNIQDIHKKTEVAAAVGVIEPTDLDQLTVQVGMLENSVKAVERQIEIAYNVLRLHTGLGADAELELTESLETVVGRMINSKDESSAYNLHDNIDMQLMESQLTIAQKQIKLEQASGLPTLAGYYQYTEKLLKPEFDISPKNTVGLTLKIPVFSSGLRNSKVKQARINLQSAENTKELLWDQLQIQEKQARFNLVNAWEQYANQNQNIEVSEKVFEMISLKYEQGLVSGIDLITASNNFVTAQNNYISSVLQLMQAGLELEKLYSEQYNNKQ